MQATLTTSNECDVPSALVSTLRAALTQPIPSFDAIHGASLAVVLIIPTRPAAAQQLAHEKLHAYPFRNVPTAWRRVYEEATLWHVVKVLEQLSFEQRVPTGQGREQHERDWKTQVIEALDMAIMLSGAPGRRSLIDVVLDALDDEKASSGYGNCKGAARANGKDASTARNHATDADSGHDLVASARPHKRLKTSAGRHPSAPAREIPSSFPPRHESLSPAPNLARPIKRISAPSLVDFQAHALNTCTPLIITDATTHWPALTRWRDPRYWLRRTHGGRRLVPVEIGAKYTDEGWGQKIMPFGAFLRGHLLGCNEGESKSGGCADERNGEDNSKDADTDTRRAVGYLAQHDLLSQVPALRNDIAVPDYCYADTPAARARCRADAQTGAEHDADASSPSPSPAPAAEPLLNIWLGPAHTTSPAHTDPHDNILAQVFGRKYVRLFAPREAAKLYPMATAAGAEAGAGIGAVDMGNTSRVDVGPSVDAAWGARGRCDGDGAVHAPTGPAVGRNALVEEDAAERDGRPPDAQPQQQGEPQVQEQEQDSFPLYRHADFVEGVLAPGECLYIPRGWWHYVRSLDVSCSVSFWWD